MFCRLNTHTLEKLVPKLLPTSPIRRVTPTPANQLVTDVISFMSKRIKALKLYNSNDNNTLFRFLENGEIVSFTRKHGSDDLNFLAHIKLGKYTQPQMYKEGTIGGLTKEALTQSNKFGNKKIIDEKLVDGFRWGGEKAEFDELGRNISKFRSGNQEIIIVDKNLDGTLQKVIESFKTRISNSQYSEQEKINELMKFVDEVFSVEKSRSKIGELVSNMHSIHLNEVLLGDIINSGAGVCRHRTLLTKILGDKIGLKTKCIIGSYGASGHAWNEITTSNGQTLLFDAMHGSIFNISKTSKNITPQVFNYRISDTKNPDKLVYKYFDTESPVGMIYRYMRHKMPIKTSGGTLSPNKNGYLITPNSNMIHLNGKELTEQAEAHFGDWVSIKDVGFQIVE